MNPGFGHTAGRAETIVPRASLSDISWRFMRYAAIKVGDLEMPAEQWTRTFPSASAMLSMMEFAALMASDMELDGESAIEIRWYVTLSTFSEGVEPTLMTAVTPFDVKNDEDEAAEQGPR
ncbi:hypothetical protein ACJZ2D_004428 [Fusarium nematophilum]